MEETCEHADEHVVAALVACEEIFFENILPTFFFDLILVKDEKVGVVSCELLSLTYKLLFLDKRDADETVNGS